MTYDSKTNVGKGRPCEIGSQNKGAAEVSGESPGGVAAEARTAIKRKTRTARYKTTPRWKLRAVWWNMKTRCNYVGGSYYHRYGGRGIQVCETWEKSFESFLKWAIKNGWGPKLQLDRRDNDRGYSPENCRFVTPSENTRNRSLSEETRARLSAAGAAGGKKVRDSGDLLRAAKKKRKPVLCPTLETWAPSAVEMSKKTSCSVSGISQVCLGRYPRTKGLYFTFA